MGTAGRGQDGVCEVRHVLDGIQKNLHRAATKIDEARKGTRTIQRKLSDVQELPTTEANALLEGLVVNVVDDHELVAG